MMKTIVVQSLLGMGFWTVLMKTCRAMVEALTYL